MKDYKTIRIPSMNIEFTRRPVSLFGKYMRYEETEIAANKYHGIGWRVPSNKEMVFIDSFINLGILDSEFFVDRKFWISDQSEYFRHNRVHKFNKLEPEDVLDNSIQNLILVRTI